jgi:predicted acyltransferase
MKSSYVGEWKQNMNMEYRLRYSGQERLFSLDAFRGFTMIWMFSMAFGLHHIKDQTLLGIPLSGLERQFTHADWHGMYAWDLIQPFFMFIVGVAMPFSIAKRRKEGADKRAELLHVLKRCALLLLLGTMARSISAGKPTFDVINVLGQLSFTYLAAYLVLDRGWKVQALAAAGLLAAHTAFYLSVSAPGVTGPWDKNANIGWWLDGAVLGKHWGGGYATINCVSSAANTIFGVMAGFWLLSGKPAGVLLRRFVILGVAGIAAGLAMDLAVPSIKKIWTASFAVYSTGYTLLALALFYWVLDVKMWRGKWVNPLIWVGMNSIFIYLFHEILYRWLRQTGLVFTGWAVNWWGAWGQALNECAVVAFQIYVCRWLYQRRIFFKL